MVFYVIYSYVPVKAHVCSTATLAVLSLDHHRRLNKTKMKKVVILKLVKRKSSSTSKLRMLISTMNPSLLSISWLEASKRYFLVDDRVDSLLSLRRQRSPPRKTTMTKTKTAPERVPRRSKWIPPVNTTPSFLNSIPSWQKHPRSPRKLMSRRSLVYILRL